MEVERITIENDPDEEGIPQDDMDGIYAKGIFDGISDYFLVNESSYGLVFTAYFDEASRNANYNEDTEFTVCILSYDLAQCFIDAGKKFFIIDESIFKDQNFTGKVILSGYPGYAQREGTEVYRSYQGILCNNDNKNGVICIKFDNNIAYCYEMGTKISIPRVKGIEGMSGGGIWIEDNDKFLPIGIIIKQNPHEAIVEGYSLESIIEIFKKIEYTQLTKVWNQHVFHVVREGKRQYDVGEIIIAPFKEKRDFSHRPSYKQRAEALLEEERLNTHPDYPSREDCLFACLDEESALNWAKDSYRDGGIFYLYEMEVIEGKIINLDPEFFEEICALFSEGQIPITNRYALEECVKNYWTGQSIRTNEEGVKEMLIYGEIKVLSKTKLIYDKGENIFIPEY